ncbi:MAG: zinc ribbon domain-containing protein [Erysipelotrichaceae bacterium]|nr:zinc ribbon domain-containing protein [Erysipelotrichaceae bacterium]
MIECPHCHKDLPDDSIYCIYCGEPVKKITQKDLEKAKKRIEEEKKDPNLKDNPRKNNWSKLGLLIFFVCLVGLDFLLATVLEAMEFNSTFVFFISFIGYVIACACGIMSLVIDYQDKKKGYQPNGNTSMAWVDICISIYIALVNLTNVIL